MLKKDNRYFFVRIDFMGWFFMKRIDINEKKRKLDIA